MSDSTPARPDADRNLLFGVLALQLDFISRDALLHAMNAWVLDKARPLGAILVDQGGLHGDALLLLEAVVAKHLLMHDGDTQKSLASVRSLHTVRADEWPSTDPDLQASLTAVLADPYATRAPLADTARDAHQAAPAADPYATLPLAEQKAPPVEVVSASKLRYRVLRPHARGGLGEVFVALDEELGREVALKEIQSQFADHLDGRTRFLLEAEITGGLEHPGIVPVYGLGAYADGRPYYAMRFIRGDSLQETIRRFHEADKASRQPGPRALALRHLLGQFVAVCNTIAYAHSRGVLHRDIKPANIMLGPYGETLVVDWGLAKTVGQSEHRSGPVEGPLQPASVSQSAPTQMGSVLGTPQYMSPEQAAGAIETLGPPSDVYSLGATLYCLLTGHPPFEDAELPQMLENVRQGHFRAPRAVRPEIPRPLEAICLKAMALKREERYASARALADDLEHWLADEPADAYREPWWVRASRWSRRHRTLVSTSAALCVTALLAVTVSYLLLAREQGRTRKAQTERVRAEVVALLDANPQAVPALLDAMKPFRAQMTPQLRELLAQTTLTDRQRMRARLALLCDDPEQLPFLRNRLSKPEVDPEEMVLLCTVLMPHRQELTADLWAEVGRAGIDSAHRFRCLVALARFDPDNARWPTVADQVVEPLLTCDPMCIGIWAEALMPVRGALLDSLGRVFRDPVRVPERRAAGGILNEYAADRPDLLADLLLDADERQFALLLPRLRHRERVVVRMKQELARTPQPIWTDTSSVSRVKPEPAIVQEVLSAAGLVDDRFALCQTLPLARFHAVADALGQAGYRPTRLRPYLSASGLRMAGVWVRDGREWRSIEGVSAAEVRRLDEQHRRDGFVPADVAGYLAPAERYAALWTRTTGPTDDTRLLVGLTETERQRTVPPLRTAGLLPQTCQVVPVPGEATRYSAVWALVPSAFDSNEVRLADLHDYEKELLIDRLLLDVSITSTDKGPRYTALWHQGGTLTAVEVHGSDPAALAVRGRELAEQGYRPAAVAVSETGGTMSSASVWHRPVVSETARETVARRQANAAVALLLLGEPEPLWPLLRLGPDPRRRTYLLHGLAALGVEAEAVVQRLEAEPDVSVRRALILSLGQYTPERLPAALRERLLPRLREWYRDDPDPGIHGAVGWLLGPVPEESEPRRLDWGQVEAVRRIDADLAGQPPGQRRWYVNQEKQTLAVIPGPVEFLMGSPYQAPQRRSDEVWHRQRIGRSFALATTTVTAEQYGRFLQSHPEIHHRHPREYSPTPDSPAMKLNWYEAVQYCRWLSEQEGVHEEQMCYPSVAEIEKSKDGKAALRLPPNVLERTGYRLPTEAEWEYACRAQSETTRFFGEAETLLGSYAWYAPNSRDRTWPVGLKMPNDLGMFDMNGNIWQWCHNEYLPYSTGSTGQAVEDDDSGGEVLSDGSRALRGGTFFLHGSSLRSAFRLYDRPTYAFLTFGFRVARTHR